MWGSAGQDQGKRGLHQRSALQRMVLMNHENTRNEVQGREGQIGKICMNCVCSTAELATWRCLLPLFCREGISSTGLPTYNSTLFFNSGFPPALHASWGPAGWDHLLQDGITERASRRSSLNPSNPHRHGSNGDNAFPLSACITDYYSLGHL